MLRVECKGRTRKNPGRKRCGGEGREIEKRRGTLGICGVAVLGIFSCGVAVNKISACGVAVFLNLTVCDVCVLKSAVFGETKLSAVSQFPFWSLSVLKVYVTTKIERHSQSNYSFGLVMCCFRDFLKVKGKILKALSCTDAKIIRLKIDIAVAVIHRLFLRWCGVRQNFLRCCGVQTPPPTPTPMSPSEKVFLWKHWLRTQNKYS